MVSSGQVNGDWGSLKSILDNYNNELDGLSGSWKGASYDGINSKADAFISEYSGTIGGEMTSFANACDLYEKYKTAKTNMQTAQSNYNTAVSNKDSSAANSYSSQVTSYQNEMNSLKTQIEAALASASSTKLTATSNTASDTSVTGGTTADTSTTQTENGAKQAQSVTGQTVTNGNVINTSQPVGTGPKYNLSQDDLAHLAYVAYREQGSVAGAKLELSLMCNLYEKNKSKYSSVRDYVENSGWFASGSRRGYSYPGDEYYNAAKEVIADGNRYLPSNVVEHDCLSDITKISTGSSNDRSNYIPNETIIYNRYGARYKFVGFAPNGGDPFGYLV